MTKLLLKDSSNSRANDSRQYLLLIVASFLLVSPLEATVSKDSSQIEVARRALADAEYPTYVMAIEAYNETFGEMRRGRLELAEKSVFQDSIISFEREVPTAFQNIKIYLFKITTIFGSGDGLSVSVFVLKDTALILNNGNRFSAGENDNLNMHISEAIPILNILLQHEGLREYSPNELLAILTSVLSLEDSGLVIIHDWDDAFYNAYGQISSEFDSDQIKQQYLRDIQRFFKPVQIDTAGCSGDMVIVSPQYFQERNSLYFKLVVYLHDGFLYELIVEHDGSSFRVEQIVACFKLPPLSSGN